MPGSSRSSGSSRSLDNNYNQKPYINNNKIPPPAQIPQTKPQESGGFISNVFQGFSFGLGSSIANKAVNGMFGNGTNTNSNQTNTNSNQTNSNQNNETTQYDSKITDYANPNYKPNPSCELLHKDFLDCKHETNSNTHCSIPYQFFKDCEDRMKLNKLDN